MVAAISAAATVGSALIQADAAGSASEASAAGSRAASALLQPWITRGDAAGTAQGELIGLGGESVQQAAIDRLRGGAEFGSLKKTGEEAILANASATGGLRGGNVQGALAQYDQSLLSKLINEQFARLGGISAQGLQAAGQGVAPAENAGAAEAGGILGVGKALVGGINGLTNAAGVFLGGGGTPPVATTPSGVPMTGGFGGGPVFA